MKNLFRLVALCLVGISFPVIAAAVQQIQIANVLYNQDASTIGVTGTAVTVKLFPTGSSTACATLTLPFQGVGTAAVGPGNACKTAVDTITVAPIAATTIGTVYSAPANYTVDPNDYNIQIMVKQRDAAAPTYYGPVFSTSNGIVATPGTAVIVSQAHLKNFKQQFAAHNHRPLQLKPMKFHA